MSTETCQFLLFPLSFLSLCSFIHGTIIKVSFFFQDFRLFFSVILTQIQYNPVYRAPLRSNDRAKHSFCWYRGVWGSVMAAQPSKKRFFRGTTYLPGEISTSTIAIHDCGAQNRYFLEWKHEAFLTLTKWCLCPKLNQSMSTAVSDEWETKKINLNKCNVGT